MDSYFGSRRSTVGACSTAERRGGRGGVRGGSVKIGLKDFLKFKVRSRLTDKDGPDLLIKSTYTQTGKEKRAYLRNRLLECQVGDGSECPSACISEG